MDIAFYRNKTIVGFEHEFSLCFIYCVCLYIFVYGHVSVLSILNFTYFPRCCTPARDNMETFDPPPPYDDKRSGAEGGRTQSAQLIYMKRMLNENILKG